MVVLYLEYRDTIKEGDGNRLLGCWKYLLPIFKASTYYTEVFKALYDHYFTLPSRQVHQQLCRFVDVKGLPGHNIAADLHIEHMNHTVMKALEQTKYVMQLQGSENVLGHKSIMHWKHLTVMSLKQNCHQDVRPLPLLPRTTT